MKKVRDYMLKGQEIFVGLEDSKRKWVLCVRSGGVIIHETRMPAEYENLRNYFNNKFPECTINVMYEAGVRGFDLHDQLAADRWHCVVTPPNRVTGMPKKISRTYGQIQSDLVRVRNRIRRTLEFHGIDKYFSPGRWNGRHYRELKEKLEEMALSSSLMKSFDILLTEMEQLRQLKTELLKEFRNLAKSKRYKKSVEILKSAPGIGPLTAIRLALEWGDMTRFKRKECFSSFLGLIPSEYSTGEQERKGHITKEESRWVRAWLIESSWVAIRYDGVLLEKYPAIWKNSGSKKKAIVAVARKLALRLRSLLSVALSS